MLPSMRAVLLGDSNDVLDEELRPIGEVRASAPVRSASKTVYAMCPYAGSRHRATRLMNLSALDQLTGVWPQPLGVLAQVRRLHGLRPGAPPPLLDLCRVGFTALCLPAHMAYRSAPRTIPARIAATHKMTQGLFGLCKNLLIDSVARGEDYRNTVVNVGELYRFAESSGILLSRTGIEACAAPPEMIGAALRLLALGASSDGDVAAQPAAMSDEDGEQLLAYGAAVADMTIWTTVAAISLRAVMERVIDSAADPATCADYLSSGFSDPVVGLVLDLHDDIRHQYGLGAIALCSDDATGAELRRVLERPAMAAPAASAPNRTAFWSDMALGIENQLLVIFDHLQQRVLAALARPPLPPAALAATVSDAFGHLPSHYLGRADAFIQRGKPLPLDQHV